MAKAAAYEKGYHKLIAWREAHRLALGVYQVTERFPKSELFGLTSQMRRAAISVAANIVEGQGRTSVKEFAHFLSIANGSLAELEYYLEVARDLGFMPVNDYEELDAIRFHTGALLHGLIASKCHPES